MAEEVPRMASAITAVRPRENSMEPRVAIKGAILHLATRKPLIKPKITPVTRMMGMVSHRVPSSAVTPVLHRAPARTAEPNSTVPMDRSIPPVAITKVTPRDKMA